jgi:hypothetical protein
MSRRSLTHIHKLESRRRDIGEILLSWRRSGQDNAAAFKAATRRAVLTWRPGHQRGMAGKDPMPGSRQVSKSVRLAWPN